MEKCIIFGAGVTGKGSWHKLRGYYEITAYTDNNRKLWGTKINGIPIISPNELRNQKDILVIVCSDYYREIAAQLNEIGIHHVAIIEPTGSMMYTYSKNEKMMPLSLPKSDTLIKRRENHELSVLFVQQIPCIRTHKIATILKEKGIQVSLAYTAEHPAQRHSEFSSVYEKIYSIFSMEDLIQFVNESDYDFVHSSNEPDSLTNLLLLTNKRIVHDTHDMMSLAYNVDMDALTLEYIANVKSHGNIYVNENNRQIAMKKFSIPRDKTFVLENRPLQMYQPKQYLQKLSKSDGQIHCVYEGGISSDPNFYRYFEEIWLKIVKSGVHVHFYSTHEEMYCKQLDKKHPNLHYEGCLATTELITQMTQYDCGLLLLNVTEEFKIYLRTSLANKVFEYICAGIPVVVGDDGENKDFVDKYCVGGYVNIEDDIKEQLKRIIAMPIDRNFFKINKLTMDTRADDLIAFYNHIIEK